MAVNIKQVNYKDMPKKAKQIRSYGKELNKEVKNAYSSIEAMHKSWFGKRYNTLCENFNKIVTQINEILQIVVTDVPCSLEDIANNYSLTDSKSKSTSRDNTGPQKIKALKIYKSEADKGLMGFIESNVESTKSSVLKNFNNAKTQMNNIDTEFKKITWESGAADQYKKRFNSLKSKIISSFEQLYKDYNSLINLTKQDMGQAESKNTVK